MADYPVRQRFCLALAAPIVTAENRDPRELAGWDREGIARARGEYEIGMHCRAYLSTYGITNRAELIAWTKGLLHGSGERAWDLARVVAVIGSAVWAEIMTEEDAWHVILLAGKLAQQAYRSWDDFAASYTRGRGEPHDLTGARAVWSELPWATDLQVTLVDPKTHVHVLSSTCPTCGAPRTRPSPTAYVYCDACGQLMDYDFAVALSIPVQQPGPVYEQLRTQLGAELAIAREGGDVDGYRVVQRQLFDAWVEACATSVPVRTKDASYRAGYVAWLAEAQVVADFDAEARAREVTMHAVVGKLTFISASNKVRVPSDQFRAMTDAMFEYEARRDELYVGPRSPASAGSLHLGPGVYALHPDGASRELQRRIGFSAFAQAWLPMLDDTEAQALLARAGLVREYMVLPAPATRDASCTHCGGPLAIVETARRVVCDHCGRLVDVIAA